MNEALDIVDSIRKRIKVLEGETLELKRKIEEADRIESKRQRGLCYDCESKHSKITICVNCTDYTCKQCRKICSTCSEWMCSKCICVCSNCKEWICKNRCAANCNKCHKAWCPDCYGAEGSYGTLSWSEIEGKMLCGECAAEGNPAPKRKLRQTTLDK